MKNILLITTLYPIFTKENRTTYVCHYFARDWVKLGYNVRVIHIQPEYNIFVKKLIFLKGKITKITPLGGYIYESCLDDVEHYVHDAVSIYRIPMHKFLPRNNFTDREIKKIGEKIDAIFKSENFVPDLITCHMLQWNIAPIINEQNKYHAKLCMVLHGCLSSYLYQRNRNWISKYNILGFRSKYMKEAFEKINTINTKSFICYSGIPENYIITSNHRSFSHNINTFIYVGALIQRKYPERILPALNESYKKDNYTLTIVGNGEMHDAIEVLAQKLNISDKIRFMGQQTREEIIQLYDAADCMIMISKNEAYGLVYLEAMARGCITIASRNEGIDGVIIDGYNGFLCESGNSIELSQILTRIRNSTQEELLRISNNAIMTALHFTDITTAKSYIDNLK